MSGRCHIQIGDGSAPTDSTPFARPIGHLSIPTNKAPRDCSISAQFENRDHDLVYDAKFCLSFIHHSTPAVAFAFHLCTSHDLPRTTNRPAEFLGFLPCFQCLESSCSIERLRRMLTHFAITRNEQNNLTVASIFLLRQNPMNTSGLGRVIVQVTPIVTLNINSSQDGLRFFNEKTR